MIKQSKQTNTTTKQHKHSKLTKQVLKEMQGAARAQAKSEGQAKAAALKSEMMGQAAAAGAHV